MNTKEKFITAIMAIVIVLLLVGMIYTLSTPKTVPVSVGPDFRSFQHGKPFRFLGTNQDVPVVKVMMAGFQSACNDYGLDCKFMTVSGNDIAGSVNMGEQSVSLGSSGIVDTIYDKAQYAPARDAIAAGIPVINGHFPITTDTDQLPGLLGWVAPDNTGYAVVAADEMCTKIKSGKVAVTQSSLNDGENAVAKAFADEMGKVCKNVTVLPVQLETTDATKSTAVASAILQANPDLAGAFSTTGGGATGWSRAVSDQSKPVGSVVIIGMDYTAENLDAVDSGAVYAVVAQPVYEEMYAAVVELLMHDEGLLIPYNATLPSPLVHKGETAKYRDILKRAEAIK